MPRTCGNSLMIQTYLRVLTMTRHSRYWARAAVRQSNWLIPTIHSFTWLHCAAAATTVGGMRVAMMTREYPPEVYGGAGVHVTELVAQLRHLSEVDEHSMGAPRPGVIVAQ